MARARPPASPFNDNPRRSSNFQSQRRRWSGNGGVPDWHTGALRINASSKDAGPQELRIWDSCGSFTWSMTNSETGQVMAKGEAADKTSAMIDAAQAAQADWGSVRWRRFDEENEDRVETV